MGDGGFFVQASTVVVSNPGRNRRSDLSLIEKPQDNSPASLKAHIRKVSPLDQLGKISHSVSWSVLGCKMLSMHRQRHVYTQVFACLFVCMYALHDRYKIHASCVCM